MTGGQVQTYLHAPLSPVPKPALTTNATNRAANSHSSFPTATSSLPPLPQSVSPTRAASRSARPPATQPLQQPSHQNFGAGPPMSYSATPAAASGSMFVPAGVPHQSYSQHPISQLSHGGQGAYVQNQSAIGDIHRSGENMEEQPTVQDKVMGKMNDLLGQAGRMVDQANRIIK